MSFRKEKKYRVTKSDFFLLKSSLFQIGMVSLHASREINSIYFDNANLQMFSDSEEGVLPRKKVRVRWYNAFSDLILEKKISSTEGRYKTAKPIKKNILPITLLDNNYGLLGQALKVTYNREYYMLNKLRITFDENIKYRNLISRKNMNFYDAERVIEVKVPLECDDDFIEKIIPYATSRFSKYSRGLMLSEWQL